MAYGSSGYGCSSYGGNRKTPYHYIKTFLDYVSLSLSYNRQLSAKRQFSEAISISSLLLKKVTKLFFDTAYISDSWTKKVTKIFKEIINYIDIIQRNINKCWMDSITILSQISTGRFLSFVDNFSLSDILRRWWNRFKQSTSWNKTGLQEGSWTKINDSETTWTRKS